MAERKIPAPSSNPETKPFWDAAAQGKLGGLAENVANADKLAKEPVKPAEPKRIDVGLVAALGVALGAIGTFLASVFTKFIELPGWQVPLVIAGILLLISGPSVLIAYLKLRKRNLGPMLDANGWAINARARINVPFGGSLTGVAALPPGAHRDMVDPFAEDNSRRNFWIVFVIIVLLGGLWYFGKLDRGLPGRVRSTTILGTNAPALWKDSDSTKSGAQTPK